MLRWSASLSIGALIGLLVAGVVYYGMALSVWTVIHSGWSVEAIRGYYQSMYVVPPVAGLVCAWIVHQILGARRARRM